MKCWNEIRKAATAFSKRWKNAYDDKSQAQSFLKEFFGYSGLVNWISQFWLEESTNAE